ncbi:M66 family metalloprotease [Erwinia tracheiphila]|uniref:ToxR-regulated lipoprotein n=1 Tax=Erwinia tracheiphila TaxID=65700 RepID=A0A345CPI0_9GAMM|nr:M66 family metalloprotease [Erwinia tracheiphila]AXF75347.1 ToxR-regulated lipoprotein [Erwinia tracheiphila]UIA82106.1 M66 family metalloprotease [Erwinia tracheiphila]UIA90702.1 M66 family metalloprotease [Erwinia tracheiphila]
MIPNENAASKPHKTNSEKLVFNNSDNTNDLQGSLSANIKFAQSQIIPARPVPGDPQPHLVAFRETLVLVKPQDNLDAITLRVTDTEGKIIGILPLQKPEDLPNTAYHIDGIPDNFDFLPLPGSTHTITTNSEINELNNPSASYLRELLQRYTLIAISTFDGSWTRDIYLPDNLAQEGRVVHVISHATLTSNIIFSGRRATISNGESGQFKFISGQWVWDGELLNQNIIYAENTWSATIPARWIKPGIRMQFDSNNRSGKLNDIKVGAPSELLIHTIDIGMLTPPRDAYAFAKDPQAHREYFQTVPISRLIVSNYQSLHLKEVMLPNGTLLTDSDPSVGGWHQGTMREKIGKELISLGINHANYGINSSTGIGEWTPYTAAQLTAHNSRGNYSNGVQVHGGSGGAGMVTLDQSLGNEFSHEVGHNYGLGHYVGGFNGSVHHAAGSLNSTWGWDKDLNRFIPNFRPVINHQASCLEEHCQAPFHGRSFGFDAMAGGEPMSLLNRFTLYTPHVAEIIQRFLEKKVVFSPNSTTGFKKWNSSTQRMEPYALKQNTINAVTAANSDLSANALSELFRQEEMIQVEMHDGNWSSTIDVPQASRANNQHIIRVKNNATWSSQLHINDESVSVPRGFDRSYLSNASVWNECIVIDMNMDRTVASNHSLSQTELASYIANFHVVSIVMTENDWAGDIYFPVSSQLNKGRVITIENTAMLPTTVHVNGLNMQIQIGENKHYISEGHGWREIALIKDITANRQPKSFGVPVTTLVGYYDPQGELPGYIYPALHGAYGFLYSDDSNTLKESDCQLWVETGAHIQRFKLGNTRLAHNAMNKFHINIAQSDQIRTVRLIYNGQTISSKTIEPIHTPLTYTINGETADDESPVVPASPEGLQVTNATANSISLVWNRLNTPVINYRIYRDGNLLTTSIEPRYTDAGLSANTQHLYAVSAVGDNNQESGRSASIAARTTLPENPNHPPTAPGNLHSTSVTSDSISLAWEASSGSSPLHEYSIYRGVNNNIISALARIPASQLTYHDVGVSSDTCYRYFVIARDALGRLSVQSNTLTLTTPAAAD